MNLAEEKISKLLLKFSIPAIIGMMVNALYNVVDRIYISYGVGTEAFSSLTVAMPLSFVIMGFGMLIGIGSGALISIRLGEGKKEEAENILGNGFMLLILASIVTTTLFLTFLEPLLLFFGASEGTLGYAKDFMSIIVAGSAFQTIGFGMNNMLRAVGKPRQAMVTNLIGAILNGLVMEPFFIFVLGWGIKGAALGTIIAQFVSMCWVLSYFFNKKSDIRIHVPYMKIQIPIMLRIFSIGMASFFMQIAGSIVSAVSNSQLVTHGGDLALGAMGLVSSVSMLFLMPIFGLNQGSQPIIGYNYGAKRLDRVQEVLKYTMTIATILCTACWVMAVFAPGLLIRIFTQDAELIAVSRNGMSIFLFAMPVIGVQIIIQAFFQAVGMATRSLILSLLRQVILLIPMFLILPMFFQLNGVWAAGPVADLFASLISIVMFYMTMKSLRKQQQSAAV